MGLISHLLESLGGGGSQGFLALADVRSNTPLSVVLISTAVSVFAGLFKLIQSLYNRIQKNLEDQLSEAAQRFARLETELFRCQERSEELLTEAAEMRARLAVYEMTSTSQPSSQAMPERPSGVVRMVRHDPPPGSHVGSWEYFFE